MDELYYGKIINADDFHYRLPDDTLNRIVVNAIIGDVECVPWLKEAPSSHIICVIEKGKLYATKLIASILASDLEQVLNLPIKPIATKVIAGYRFNAFDKLELVKIIYELYMPLDYTGILNVNQIFIDETQYPNGVIHKALSSFAFNNGMLDTNKSMITRSYQTTFEDSGSLWHDDIPNMNITQPANTYDGCRRYFVNPVGTMRQNHYIIDVVCSYIASVNVSDGVLDWIFSHEEPVLKKHLKTEVTPGSGLFKDRVYNLVAEAHKREDTVLLNRINDRLLTKAEGRKYA